MAGDTTSNQNKNYTGNDGRSSTFGRNLAAFIQNKLPYANIIDTENNQLNPKYKVFADAGLRRTEALAKNSVSISNEYNNLPIGSIGKDSSFGQVMYANIQENKGARLRDYRIMAAYSDVADALDELCDETINTDENGCELTLKLRHVEMSSKDKTNLDEEFNKFAEYFDFKNKGWQYFRQLLVEGELFFELIIHKDYIQEGVLGAINLPTELIDPVYNNIQNMMVRGFIYRKPLVFNVDVSTMPAPKAEAYLKKLIANYWSSKTFDVDQGDVVKKFNPQSMLDAFWFPKRAGSEGSSVSQLAGGQNLGELTDLMYFVKKLYRSLKVPTSRLDPADAFRDGAEILREELKMARFIIRQQQRFAAGIKRGFITHLQLKGVWEKLELDNSNISVEFNVPTNFYEMRENQRLEQRASNYSSIASNEFVSKTYAQKKYLQWKDKDILANREFLRKDAELQWELQQITTLGPAWREQIIAADVAGPEAGGMGPEAGGMGGGMGGVPPAFGGGEAAVGAAPPGGEAPSAEGAPPETPPPAA